MTPAARACSSATASTFFQSTAVTCTFGLSRASTIPNIPWPAATSSTFQPGAFSTSRRLASMSPVIPASGAMARANSTQTGFSAESVPSSSTAVPPFRTASVNRAKHSVIFADAMNVIAEPT